MPVFFKKISFVFVIKIFIIFSTSLALSAESFDTWLNSFKKNALKKGISQETLDLTFANVKFLDQVIKYDRRQPEFYEDTVTYVSKRANATRVRQAHKLLKQNKESECPALNKTPFSSAFD